MVEKLWYYELVWIVEGEKKGMGDKMDWKNGRMDGQTYKWKGHLESVVKS